MAELIILHRSRIRVLLLFLCLVSDRCSSWLMRHNRPSSPSMAVGLSAYLKLRDDVSDPYWRRGLSLQGSNSNDVDETTKEESTEAALPPLPKICVLHHTALKTRNITTAIQFYSLFGYQVEGKFRAGPARAVWLELKGSEHRLELIEVPAHILNELLGQKRRAMDLMERQDLLGYNHVALDVSSQISGNQTLSDWLTDLNEVSLQRFGKSLRIALEPKQQLIGSAVYELAFLYDADGCLVEILRFQAELPQQVDSGWEPWNGTGFAGLGQGVS
jgi:catechol 2,3-dioxygenase-like lactoylglutathione lyase family enzyme